MATDVLEEMPMGFHTCCLSNVTNPCFTRKRGILMSLSCEMEVKLEILSMEKILFYFIFFNGKCIASNSNRIISAVKIANPLVTRR